MPLNHKYTSVGDCKDRSPRADVEIHRQFFRYSLTGLASNVVLYVGYLFVTSAGIGHKTAITFLYIIGVLQTYVFNRRWTFFYRGNISGSMSRYVTSYVFGYLFNLGALFVLVDKLGLPHRVVQAVLTLLVAAMIFLLQKYWVFRKRAEHTFSVHKINNTRSPNNGL